MDDLARLQIRVQSSEAELASQRLKTLANTGDKAERATDGLTGTFKRLLGPLVAAAGAVATLTKVVDVQKQFGALNAQLITATGSATSAAVAFDAIQGFASRTPFDLAGVTEAFVKLVNLGLDPSERALTSYGNTASAMGKDLEQLIEAVADAATGEFERLKEFGIKSKSEGDKVSFTFRGVTTQIGKNAAEIEQYLINLGENEFAGAMTERTKTLGGALSNLGDEWDKLFLNISQQGVGDLITSAVRMAIDVLEELNGFLGSGQMQGYLSAITGHFTAFGEDAARSFRIIVTATDDIVAMLTEAWNGFFGDGESGITGATSEVIDFIVAAFKNLPANIRAVVQLMAVEFGALVDYGLAYGGAFVEVVTSEFQRLVETAGAYSKAIAQALNPFDEGGFDLATELNRIDARAANASDSAWRDAGRAAEITAQAHRESIIAIVEERETALDSFSTQIAAANKLRDEYDKNAASQKNVLGQFGLGAETPANGGGGTSKAAKAAEKAAAKAADVRAKEFANLVNSLRTEEEVIQQSYEKRLAIILNNTEEGSKAQATLKSRLDAEFAGDSLGWLAAPDTFDEQIAEIENFYNARRELILSNVALTEEQRTELEEELTRQRNERIMLLEQERLSVLFAGGAELFDGLSGLAKKFAGEQSVLYRGMFAASKAFAIADAAIKIQQGIAGAAALPFPANLGAIASVISATSGVLGTISGAQYAGAYDKGGNIPYGKIGMVGENGPEIVRGPSAVTSTKDTAAILAGANQQQAPQSNIRIVNNVDPAVFEDYLGSSAGEEIIMNTIRNNPETIRAVGGA